MFMKKFILLLFLFPLSAQTINDTDDAFQERRQEIIEENHRQNEREWKQRDFNRKRTIKELIKEDSKIKRKKSCEDCKEKKTMCENCKDKE